MISTDIYGLVLKFRCKNYVCVLIIFKDMFVHLIHLSRNRIY